MRRSRRASLTLSFTTVYTRAGARRLGSLQVTSGLGRISSCIPEHVRIGWVDQIM